MTARRISGSRPWAQRLFAVAILFWGLFFAACEASHAPSPRGIVLISVDAVRKDLLSIYGGDVEVPNLARLADHGTVFEDAATVCPMSRPSVTSLLTGLPPDRSGVRDDLHDRLPSHLRTVAHGMRDGGRETLAIAGTPFCSETSGLLDGFELFDAPLELTTAPTRYFPRSAVKDAEVVRRFADWLAVEEPAGEFFAWIHLAGLHGLATSRKEIEDSLSAYREGLGLMDRALGTLLDVLEQAALLEDTAIVFVGTHGVFLGEEGARGSAYWLAPETLEVPLVIKGVGETPGFEPGSRSSARAWLPDVAATLAWWGGATLAEGAEGLDLAREAASPGSRVRRAWTWAPEDQIAWPTLTAVDDASGWEVYNWNQLNEEAAESDAAEPQAIELARSRPARPRPRELPAHLREKLEAEGIIESWEEIVKPEPPPAERNEFLVRLQRLRHHAGRVRRAMREGTRDLIEEHPGNLAILVHRIALVVSRSGEIRAGNLAHRALQRYPERPDVLHWAGHAMHVKEKLGRAELLFEAAAALRESDPDLMYDLACLRALNGDTDEALVRLERAIEAGFRNLQLIERDPDLASIRGDARFAALLRAHGR